MDVQLSDDWTVNIQLYDGWTVNVQLFRLRVVLSCVTVSSRLKSSSSICDINCIVPKLNKIRVYENVAKFSSLSKLIFFLQIRAFRWTILVTTSHAIGQFQTFLTPGG